MPWFARYAVGQILELIGNAEKPVESRLLLLAQTLLFRQVFGGVDDCLLLLTIFRYELL